MRLGGRRVSTNIENRRGQGGGFGRMPGGLGGGGGPMRGGGMLPFLLPLLLRRFGIGGVLVVGLGFLLLSQCQGGLGGLTLGDPMAAPPGAAPAGPTAGTRAPIENETDRFVAQVLATTEDSWGAIFAERGQRYQEPVLVFFDGAVRSACGSAASATGPFYCPLDSRVYLDTSFFRDLATRFGAPGQFAAAYVIAHEVGHHVQNLEGTIPRMQQAQARASRAEANQLNVRLELQADCYAGVWASRNRDILDEGSFAEGVRAAEAIGDDRLQQRSGGRVVPDSFTHGSSAQRVRWLTTGFRSGDPAACDTFGPPFERL